MATIIDSYSETNRDDTDNITMYAGSYTRVGQTFTGDGSTLGSAQLMLSKTGTPAVSVVAVIYGHTGTYGTNGTGTGAALATSEAISTTTLGTMALVTFTFTGANKITLDNGTNYTIVAEYVDNTGTTSSSRINLGTDLSSPTHAGNFTRYFNSAWYADATRDIIFYVYAEEVAMMGGSGGPFKVSSPTSVIKEKRQYYVRSKRNRRGWAIVNKDDDRIVGYVSSREKAYTIIKKRGL